MLIVVMVQGQADLFEMAGALDPVTGSADLLHCWQQQADQNRENGQDYQKFDERKASPERFSVHHGNLLSKGNCSAERTMTWKRTPDAATPLRSIRQRGDLRITVYELNPFGDKDPSGQPCSAGHPDPLQGLRAIKLEELSSADLLRYAVEAAKLERLARGEPASIGEQRHSGTDGNPIRFLLEEVIAEERRREEQQHGPVQPGGGRLRPPDGRLRGKRGYFFLRPRRGRG